MSEKRKDIHGKTINHDYQGYYTVNNVGQRIDTDMYGKSIQDSSSYDLEEDMQSPSVFDTYKGNNIFIKIIMFVFKIFFGFLKVLSKMASSMTFGR